MPAVEGVGAGRQACRRSGRRLRRRPVLREEQRFAREDVAAVGASAVCSHSFGGRMHAGLSPRTERRGVSPSADLPGPNTNSRVRCSDGQGCADAWSQIGAHNVGTHNGMTADGMRSWHGRCCRCSTDRCHAGSNRAPVIGRAATRGAHAAGVLLQLLGGTRSRRVCSRGRGHAELCVHHMHVLDAKWGGGGGGSGGLWRRGRGVVVTGRTSSWARSVSFTPE